jgi:hypothetical protein
MDQALQRHPIRGRFDAVVSGASRTGLATSSTLQLSEVASLQGGRYAMPRSGYRRGRVELDAVLHKLSGIPEEGYPKAVSSAPEGLGRADERGFVEKHDLYRPEVPGVLEPPPPANRAGMPNRRGCP